MTDSATCQFCAACCKSLNLYFLIDAELIKLLNNVNEMPFERFIEQLIIFIGPERQSLIERVRLLKMPQGEGSFLEVSHVLSPLGIEKIKVHLKTPCSKLNEEGGLYMCGVWDNPSQKPEICSRFPSSAFLVAGTNDLPTRDPEKIEELRASLEERCPAIRKIRVIDILTKPLFK